MPIFGDLFNNAKSVLSIADSEVKVGDVIGISRGIYEHFGIYIGNGKVIHYASLDGDISEENEIREAWIDQFLDGATKFYSIDFERINRDIRRKKILDSGISTLAELKKRFQEGTEYSIYSPKETIKRAKSKIGEHRYNLLKNNCEHFAFWCKTGEKECNQYLTKSYRNYHEYDTANSLEFEIPKNAKNVKTENFRMEDGRIQKEATWNNTNEKGEKVTTNVAKYTAYDGSAATIKSIVTKQEDGVTCIKIISPGVEE